jgi:hypothetical protein
LRTSLIVFPRTPGVKGLNDMTPRVGLACDLFGNGRTENRMQCHPCIRSVLLPMFPVAQDEEA